MKYMMRILLVVLALGIYRLPGLAQTANYTGTWVLNLGKSKLEYKPKGLTGSVFIIQQVGDKFHLTRYHIFGEKKNKISFGMVADGATRRVKVLFKGKLEQKENYLQATLWRRNFLNIVDYKFGNGQNEFIADERLTSKPNNHHNIWVFDRETAK